MRAVRRNSLEVRFEMTPLIDVIFLLLTFFIYSLVMMVRAEVLPVTLATIRTGQSAEPAEITAITLDKDGKLYLDQEPITPEALDGKLSDMARRPDRPRLYIAMEQQGNTDRGPALITLIERVRAAGIEDFLIVGMPQ